MTFEEAAQPIFLEGSADLGVLLVHGFTATPGTVAAWASGVHKATGATVSAPLLPGHGTKWQDLNEVTWEDWETAVLAAWDILGARCKKVAVGGLSLGGTLAVLAAARRPATVGLVLVNHLMWLGNPTLPLTPILKRFIPAFPAIGGDLKDKTVVEPTYDQNPLGGVDQLRRLMKAVRPLLPGLKVPTLLFKSLVDHVVPRMSTLKTLKVLGSARKELIWLENSWHVATMDQDLPLIVEKTAQFLGTL